MSLFICDGCGVVENTAFGNYWSYRFNSSKEESSDNLALCSLCSSPQCSDEMTNLMSGGWHDKFNREFPSKADILKIGLASFQSSRKLKEILADK